MQATITNCSGEGTVRRYDHVVLELEADELGRGSGFASSQAPKSSSISSPCSSGDIVSQPQEHIAITAGSTPSFRWSRVWLLLLERFIRVGASGDLGCSLPDAYVSECLVDSVPRGGPQA